MEEKLVAAYKKARQRLLLFDYDGVLAPIVGRPEQAAPSGQVLDLLSRLAAPTDTTVVVISGRDQATLEQWLGALPIDMSAEHGHFAKRDGKWSDGKALDMSWRDDVIAVMHMLEQEYPGSHIETKQASVVWHYRQAQKAVNEPAALERIARATAERAEVMPGKCVVDVRARGADKGEAAVRWYDMKQWDFVLCIGDDVTDEAMFAALPATAWTVKVGEGETCARLSIKAQPEIIGLLEALAVPSK